MEKSIQYWKGTVGILSYTTESLSITVLVHRLFRFGSVDMLFYREMAFWEICSWGGRFRYSVPFNLSTSTTRHRPCHILGGSHVHPQRVVTERAKCILVMLCVEVFGARLYDQFRVHTSSCLTEIGERRVVICGTAPWILRNDCAKKSRWTRFLMLFFEQISWAWQKIMFLCITYTKKLHSISVILVDVFWNTKRKY